VVNLFFVAGESSGDIHGANVIAALRAIDDSIACEGLGGRRMAEAGMHLLEDLAGRAIMGFTEVVKSFPYIRQVFHRTVERLRQTRPDGLVLIDYPGFNIRLAQEAQRIGIPVVYYISPQVWAWKRGRIRTLSQCVRKMLVIFPFEEALYREAGVDCIYVGHPLLDHIRATPAQTAFTGDPVLAILPGSREQEIRRICPIMIQVARGIVQHYPNAQFVIPCVDERRELQVREMLPDLPISTVVGNTYDVLRSARFALVASGTATLEATFFEVPMVILYRITTLSYLLARMVVDIEHIGMVNILAGKRVVPEFVQHDADPQKILPVALDLIADSPVRETMMQNLRDVKAKLGPPGASARAAKAILDAIGKN